MLLQGGASLQFAMVPMNLLGEGKSADYILTGSWGKKAIKEARLFGAVRVAATTEKDGVFRRIPRQQELALDPGAVYCHITSNNTIFGTQWRQFPDTGSVPLAALSTLAAVTIMNAVVVETVLQIVAKGGEPPVRISRNMPLGDEHNERFKRKYGARIPELVLNG